MKNNSLSLYFLGREFSGETLTISGHLGLPLSPGNSPTQDTGEV